MPFIMALKNKYPRINVTRKERQTSILKLLLRTKEENLRKKKDMPCLWKESHSIRRMVVFFKLKYRFSEINKI